MGDQSFVSQATRARVRNMVTPIALAMGKVGLTPNALTVIGFLISGVAAAAAAEQLWLAAAALVIFGGSFDMLDGGLARAQNRVTRFGAFLDSTLDRWGEGVVYIGIVAGASAALVVVPSAASTEDGSASPIAMAATGARSRRNVSGRMLIALTQFPRR